MIPVPLTKQCRILVLDHGKVMEYGTPWELMQNEGGIFRELCKQSGEETQLWEVSQRSSLLLIGTDPSCCTRWPRSSTKPSKTLHLGPRTIGKSM